MSNSSYKTLICILALLGLLAAAATHVQAWPAANVGLTRFEAVPMDNAVRLEWDTATELETAGYRLKRGQDGSFDYLVEAGATSPLFISSQGGPATGASYTFTDATVLNGESYIYQLVEVEVNGSEIIQAESDVLVGLIPTDTPIVLTSGGGGSTENNAAATVTASATAAPTELVATPQVQTAVAASATPLAAVSPSPSPTTSAVPTSQTSAEPAAQVAAAHEIQPTPVMKVREANTDLGPKPAVALAQENPPSYPPEEPTIASPSTADDQQGQQTSPATAGSAQPGDSSPNPTIIGATAYPINPQAPAMNSGIENTDSTSNRSVFAGRVYLWVGFLAAIVIFSAAVLGAILLYTRRRSKE